MVDLNQAYYSSKIEAAFSTRYCQADQRSLDARGETPARINISFQDESLSFNMRIIEELLV